MLIVIEGADRTGKTTLAGRLAKEAGDGWYVHRSAPQGHPLEEYETFLDDYVPGGQSWILDRWHWGERVWPRVFGRETQYDEAMLRHTDMYIRSRGGVIVYAARTNLERWHHDLVANDEPINMNSGLPLALDLYGKVRAGSYLDLGKYWYDFESTELLRQYYRILHDAQFGAELVAPLHDISSEWIGSPRPATLLVGDRYGSFREGSPNVPFAPYRGTCGHYLMETLADSWRDVAICNSVRGDGEPERVADLWQVMGCPRVIAMGRDAQKRCARTLPEEAWDAVPHPQYWRRFQRKAGQRAYLDMFQEAGL